MKDCFFLGKFPPPSGSVNSVARCLHFVSAGSLRLPGSWNFLRVLWHGS
jgi:hypothetical protein